MRHHAFTLVLLFSAGGAGAGGFINESSNQLYHWKQPPMSHAGGVVTAWIDHVPMLKDDHVPVEGVSPSLDDLKLGARIGSVLMSFKCRERMSATVQWVFYRDLLRQDVESQSPATSQASLNYAHVVPGTVGEGHLDWACNFNSPADSQAHRLEPRAEHRR